MKLSHPGWIVAPFFTAAALLGASCSFPQIDFFEPTSDSSAGSGGNSPAGASNAAGGGNSPDSSSTGTVGGGGGVSSSASNSASSSAASSATSSSSSNAASSSSGGTNCPLDEDGDGAVSAACAGGTDCADHDPKAHPEPPSVSFQSAPILGATAPNTLLHDFNCDGQETGETSVLNCQLPCLASASGYQAPVKCGEAGLLGHCEPVTCLWKPDNPPKNRVQKCK